MAKRIDVNHVNIYYGAFKAVEDVSMTVEPRSVTAFIGPSGCGKSTVLRTLNRMHEVIPGGRVEGEIALDGKNPVSYTHLDVYKRQLKHFASADSQKLIEQVGYAPVSYTHLDVYKRQSKGRTGPEWPRHVPDASDFPHVRGVFTFRSRSRTKRDMRPP